MFKKSFILLLSLALSISIFSQKNSADTIQIVKAGGGYNFRLNGETINVNNMQVLMQNNTEALKYLKKAKTTNGFLSVISYAGGFLIGYPLGTLIGGGEPNWMLAAVGCGLVAIAIPISSSVKSNARKAVSIYNSGLSGTSYRSTETYNLHLSYSQNGLGLCLTF